MRRQSPSASRRMQSGMHGRTSLAVSKRVGVKELELSAMWDPSKVHFEMMKHFAFEVTTCFVFKCMQSTVLFIFCL